jgi:uncharacterized protein
MATKQIWLNLPVKDVNASIHFYKTLGFTQNSHFGNSNDSACFLIGESNFVLMLFIETQFKAFIKGETNDTSKSSEMLMSIDAESRAEVDELAANALKAGGSLFGEPSEIQGWMYGCGFCDPDGHKWNVLFMDMDKMPK